MKTRRLLVTKPHKYGTRHLTAGEEYEVPIRHAVALVAAKKARFASNKPWWEAEAKPEAKAEATVKEETAAASDVTVEANNIDRLRAEAGQLGIMVDGRWGVARLQHEIATRQR